MIYKQYEIVTTNIKNEITALLKDGDKFSVSLEYSSLRNRGYLNINIHTAGKHWNLGMITIVGRMTAERIVEAVELKLCEFGLNLKTDIVSVVTDGASVMKKFGKLIPCEQNLCLAHTIHLAVCDVLYKKQKHNTDDFDSESEEMDVEAPEGGADAADHGEEGSTARADYGEEGSTAGADYGEEGESDGHFFRDIFLRFS